MKKQRPNKICTLRNLSIPLLLSLYAAQLGSAQVITIDNDIPSGSIGHYRLNVEAGGEARDGYITAERFAAGTVTTDEIIFDYSSFVDVGSGGFRLSGTTVTSGPILTGDDTVTSTGTFIGEGDNVINWQVTTSVANNSSRMSSKFTFTAQTGFLGELVLHQYLDEDVNQSVDNDILFVRGSVDRNDLELFTVDGPQIYGIAHGGTYRPGVNLVNADFIGWGADQYPSLQSAIENGTANVSLSGVINPRLPQINNSVVGTAYGPRDITSTLAWRVNPLATSATITTTVGGVPLARELQCVVDGVIWQDTNQDRLIDENLNTNGVNGVEVQLLLDDAVFATATSRAVTNVTIDGVFHPFASGYYEFEDVPDGDYTIQVVQSSFVQNIYRESTTNNNTLVTVEAGVRCPEVNFGFFDDSCTVTGFVWDDLDRDGILDPNETLNNTGLNGVDVRLVQNDTVFATATTRFATNVTIQGSTVLLANGYFEFPNIIGGAYSIEVVSDTLPFAIPMETTERVGSPVIVNKNEGCAEQIALGYTRARCTATGFVWRDTNPNGVLDADESLNGNGLNGVIVRLIQGDTTYTTTTRTTSDVIIQGNPTVIVDGYFEFPDLFGGDYRIEVDPSSVQLESPVETTALSGTILTIDPLAGCPELPLGFRPSSCTITGAIWRDANRNGTLDEDLEADGLEGVEVRLVSGATILSGVTEADGNFQIPGAVIGTYQIQIDASTVPLGSPYETTAINGTSISIGDGLVCPDILIGYAEQTCTVAGFVWRDNNRNGVFDGTEQLDGDGLNGVTLRLMQGANVRATDTTHSANDVFLLNTFLASADGYFEFQDVIDGTYTIEIDTASVPLNNSQETTGLNFQSITINPGSACPELALGFAEPGACVVSGFVWHDVDGNGITNEELSTLGLQNVPVTLRALGDPATTQQTSTATLVTGIGEALAGYYEFRDLAPGLYEVSIDPLAIPADLDIFVTDNNPGVIEVTASGTCPSVNFGFRPSAIFGPTGLLTTLFTWRLDRQTGLLYCTVEITNPTASGQEYTGPFWFAFDRTATGYLVTPDGQTEAGQDYIDVTAGVLSALSSVGDNDAILDAGETVQVMNVGAFFSRTRAPIIENNPGIIATARATVTTTPQASGDTANIGRMGIDNQILSLELTDLSPGSTYDIVCVDALYGTPWIVIDTFVATTANLSRNTSIPQSAISRFYQVVKRGPAR